MKRKISAILTSAMMIIGSMVSTVSAYKVDSEIWVEGELYSFEEYLELLTPDEYLNAISSELSKFISSENLNAQVLHDDTGKLYLDENGDSLIIVNYYYTHTDIKPAVEAFIEENNFDSSHIIYQAVGSENSDTSEKITDLYLILALVSDYIDLNVIPAQALIGDDKIEVHVNWYEDTAVEEIEAFIDEKNIDESLVHILILEGDECKVLGDANIDGQVNVRDCAFIASSLANGTADELIESSDFNGDGEVNVRDAAAIATHLASK